VDQQTREGLQRRLARHRRPRRWVLPRPNRCRECGEPWPCFGYLDARSALRIDAIGTQANWADLATQPNPQVSPLMTRGQEYRASRRSP
jgi:hypothetical protein